MKDQRLKLILNILVMLLSLYVISQKNAAYYKTSLFENIMIDAFAPMQRSIYFFKQKISSFFTHYALNINASQENEVLKRKILNLQKKIFEDKEVSQENDRLKELLKFGKEIKQERVLAQIVSWDASSDFKVLRINKGYKDGIKLQSPVVTAEGVVGYVFRLTGHFAEILTILDPNNRVDGIVQRLRAHGIVEGFSSGRCLVKYVTRTEFVILNDLLLTSGLGNIYPKGLRIGTISKIEKESYGITQHIEIVPSVNFSKLEEVIVLVSKSIQISKKEWKELDKDIIKGKSKKKKRGRL